MKNTLNFTNLQRIISINNIKKFKVDTNNDFLGITNLDNFKDKNRFDEGRVIQMLQSLGHPRYVKTNFKTKTIHEFTSYSGKYWPRSIKKLKIDCDK